MCGRFTQNLSWAEIHRLADLIGQPRNLAPRFNIAPTTPIEVIRATDAGNELVPMYWGLVPSWWKKTLKELPGTFNARAETLAERPMFRGAFKYRRCIIPASVSTPESYCSGWPARKCSRDASKKAPDIGGLFACRGFF